MNIKKPETFEDLLELQKILDEEVSKKRYNGFIPRKRTWTDMKLSLLDEFMEWLKELPQEVNFKTWKQKTYNREKELEEYVDCLFFFLQLINSIIAGIEKEIEENENCNLKEELKDFKELSLVSDFSYNEFFNLSSEEYKYKLEELTDWFIKYLFYYEEISSTYYAWLDISALRKFTKQEILDTYFSKWQKNMNRIKGDWTK